jgi:hypothetical protein
MDQQLEGVEEEEYAGESQGAWEQVSDTVIHACVHVEAGVAPNDEDCNLEEHNVAVISLVKWDFLGSSN